MTMKTYIQPQTTVIRIGTMQMIAASDMNMRGDFSSSNETGNGGAGVLSRGGSFWDDDEEEY